MREDICYGCMAPRESGDAVCPHCGFQAAAYRGESYQLSPGAMLRDRYEIGRVLGEGGFGITYVGLDTVLDLKVAIKEFYMFGYVSRNNSYSASVEASGSANAATFEKNRERFLREARVLARFSNEEGIVGIRDFFKENNTAYIVMDFLSGETLRDHLNRVGRLSVERTLAIMDPILASLANVHDHNVIHRDISPDNIMLTGDGKVKLLDFGAAREISNADIKSLSVILKPGYAPEEQYRSKGRQGAWTDIYALSGTMYRCITGQTPDDSMERMFDDRLMAPVQLDCGCSPALSSVIMKGLAVRQENRYQTIREFRTAIEQALAEPENESIGLGAPGPVRKAAPLSGDENATRLAAEVSAPGAEDANATRVAEELLGPDERPAQAAEAPPPPAPVPSTEVPEEPASVTVAPADDETEKPADKAEKPAAEPKKKSGGGIWALLLVGLLICGAILFALRPWEREEPAAEPVPIEAGAVDVEALFEKATHLVDYSGTSLRKLMNNDGIKAVIIPGNASVYLEQEPLMITKPLLIREGGWVGGEAPITVDGGYLRIEGEMSTEGILRTAGGGSIDLGETGRLQVYGGAMLWCENDADLNMADGAVLELDGQRFGDGGNRSLVFSEEEVLGNAASVRSPEEFQEALNGGASAILVEGDLALPEGVHHSVPVIIAEGVTVSVDSESGGRWNVEGTVLVNRGELTGTLAGGGAREKWNVINYGRIACELDAGPGSGAGSLVNYGEMAVTRGFTEQVCLTNMGAFRKTGAGEDNLDMTGESLRNYGEMILEEHEGGNPGDCGLTLTGEAQFTNFGLLCIEKGNGLMLRAGLQNRGQLVIGEGGRIVNDGIIENTGGVIEEQGKDGFAPESAGFVLYNGNEEKNQLLLQREPDRYDMKFIPFASDMGDAYLTFVETPEGLLTALEDENCRIAFVRGDLLLEDMGEVIVKDKGLVVTEELTLRGTDLTVSGGYLLARRLNAAENAFTVEREGAALLENQQNGGITLLSGGRAALRYWASLDGPLEVVNGARLFAYGGMELHGPETVIDGRFAQFGAHLGIHGGSLMLGRRAVFDNFGNTDVAEDVSIENEGQLALNRFYRDSHSFRGSLLNRGNLDWGSAMPIEGSLVNEGELHVHNWDRALEVWGSLENNGEIYLHGGANIVAMGEGAISGSEPQPGD